MIEPSQQFVDANRRSLRRTLDAMALVVPLIISISLPMGFGLIAFDYEDRIGSYRASLYARRIAAHVYQNRELWQYNKSRLAQIIERSDVRGDSRSRVTDATGRLVLEEDPLSQRFQLTRTAPIVVADTTVGFVETRSPLDQLISQIGLAALLGLLLGICAYLVMRIFPLRMLDRTLAELAQADLVIRDKNAVLELQNKALREREEALQTTEAVLKQRSGQLLEAQQLGKLGDWSYRFGEATISWAAEVSELFGYSRATFNSSLTSVMANYLEDGAQRMLESQGEVIRSGTTRSVDVKIKRRDGSVGDFAVTSKPMLDDQGRTVGLFGTIQDISERKSAEAQLEKLAYYDPLTGLANRAMFRREIAEVINRCSRTGSHAALLLLDLDRFKEVNDSLGHAAGDELLGRVAQLVSGAVGSRHFIARLGGDEFAIVLTDYEEDRLIEDFAHQVLASISGPIQLERGEVTVGTSIGIAVIPRDGSNINDVVRGADLALYRAKENGRGRFHFFESSMRAAAQHKVTLSRDLRQAITDNRGLAVHYQPQVDLVSNRVTGYEALMRWTHPTLGNVPPSEFIPIAESSQLICDLGIWILRAAASQAKAWLDAGEPPREIAVNVSAAQIRHTDFVGDVVRVLAETGLPPQLLCLELTESLLADHAEGRVRGVLTELKQLGVTLALDDFGTDYSSLGYLTQLPFDKLKIDRIFVDGIVESRRARKLLEGVIALGRGLGMTIVMEGVERPEEVAILRDFNCDIVQGYVFARPAVAPVALAFAMDLETAADAAQSTEKTAPRSAVA